ncbi:MAG: CPBP family intramembrane glutamic endopeptidase [Acidobacteriaceae bacterium]
MTPSAILLALCLGSLAWFVRKDLAEYRAFKLLTETTERQKRYRRWAAKSFLLFSGTTMAALAILGRLRALVELPPEFRRLFDALNAHASAASNFNSGVVGAFLGALVVGLFAGLLLPRLRRRRGKPVQVGDIAALLPRNGAETAWTALLSVNAGVGEEIYFRLLLPLLLVSLGSGALAAFVIAGLIFGAMHFYQGIAGIVATTVIGGAMAALYLWTGDLWIAAGAHALLDLVGLVIRPTLQRLFAQKTAVGA